MIPQWKKHDERRNILIFFLISITICTVLRAFMMVLRLPFPNELKTKVSNTLIHHQKKNPMIIPDSEFIYNIQNLSQMQYHYYQKNCKGSDVFRPLTHICRNYTQSSETFLSYLAVNQLFMQSNLANRNNHNFESLDEAFFNKNLRSLSIKKKIGIEIGRYSDFVIAPLISAYYTTKNENYIQRAISLCKDILEVIGPEKPIPAPFIGYSQKEQHLGEAMVFIDDVSSIFPVLASIAHITQDTTFLDPVQNFVNHIRKSIFKSKQMKAKKKEFVNVYNNTSNAGQLDALKLSIPVKFSLDNGQIGISSSKFDFPYRLFADLNRISRILPSIQTDDIIQVGISRLNKENPTVIYDENYIKVVSIEPCWFSSILHKNDPMYSLLVKKCKSLIKRKPTPSRMNGNSEFGGYDMLTQFEFDGEILETLWKNENINEAKNLILNAIKECTYDKYITGLRNTTFDGKRSDNFLHPQFFSRWILNAVLIETGIKYDDIVLSDNGNILKM